MLKKALTLAALLLLANSPLFGDPYTIKAQGCIDLPVNAPGTSAEFAAYKLYTREVLHSHWRREMKINESSLWFGKVCIHCIIHSDGSLSALVVTVGDSTGLLKTVSRDALLQSAPFKPFTQTMIKEVGYSYPDDFVFQVTRAHEDPTSLDRSSATGSELD